MIIHPPQIRVEGDEVCVAARVRVASRPERTEDELWFRFPAHYREFVTTRADAFAASLIYLAMFYGEDLQVRGVLSPRLAFGLRDYQKAVHAWAPQFKPVNVEAERYAAPAVEDKGAGVGCAFSGGVDSFYTLWSHLPEHEPLREYRLTHALLVQGFDILLEEVSTFDATRRSYGEMIERLGLGFIPARTNIRALTSEFDPMFLQSAITIGSGLVLARLFRAFMVAADAAYGDWMRDGLGPHLDPQFSTETLQVIHDGAGATRVEKILTLTSWRETHTRLRVCYEKRNGLVNCCRCRKCVLTMVTLKAAGALDQYETFPLPLTRRAIWRLRYPEGLLPFLRRAIDYAWVTRRFDVWLDLQFVMLKSRALVPLRALKRNVLRARGQLSQRLGAKRGRRESAANVSSSSPVR